MLCLKNQGCRKKTLFDFMLWYLVRPSFLQLSFKWKSEKLCTVTYWKKLVQYNDIFTAVSATFCVSPLSFHQDINSSEEEVFWLLFQKKRPCTASCTSSSDLKWRPGPRQSLDAKSDLYGGWDTTSTFKSWICFTVWRACAVGRCHAAVTRRKTSNPRRLLWIAGLSSFRSVLLYQSLCLYT